MAEGAARGREPLRKFSSGARRAVRAMLAQAARLSATRN